jgi:hypothetical protein
MAGRTRTTKKLAQRIDRGYFKMLFLIPRWKRILTFGITGIGLLWAGWGAVSGKQIYSAGPLAHAHKIVSNNCQACHAQPSTWGTVTADMTCLKCHDAPVHQASQTFTPACATCHVEHQNAFRLAATSQASCTQCHADLKVKQGDVKYAKNIRSLSDGHPEFAAVRPGHAPDPATIKLNHQVHLKKDLKGPNGPVQMVCVDCHQQALPGEAATTTTAMAAMAGMSPAQIAAITPERKALSPEMAPVTYEKDCKSCHPLNFDPRFPPAPHQDTKAVEDFVRMQYADYIRTHPGEARQPVQPLSPDAPYRRIQPPPANAGQWIAQSADEAERLLFQKDCKECHQLTYPVPDSRPEVPKANETVRWMKNAWFDHKPHQLVACAECHTDAPNSQKTEDVLLPKIATCQKCHNEASNAAGATCSECHVYHDWPKAKPIRTASTISEVIQ